ncbi:MAG: hypothetical protein VX733_04195 [Candidatus Latescibacterota bacterium]|nr:hypothetical protein [Candidatus Latescibacterota bacterium]
MADHAETQTACVAFSDDGIEFHRPELDLLPGDGGHNVVFRGYEGHNFCVFRDDNPNSSSDARYKAVGGSGKNRLFGFQSPDGLHWHRMSENPLEVEGAFDSVNVPLWDPHAGRYRLMSRYFHQDEDGQGARAIQSCTSDDFLHWTRPKPHLYATDDPREHFYTNATVCCPGAEHILLSFPMRFLPQRTWSMQGMDYPGEGLSDAVFISSRDGVHWDRTFREAWMRPGLDSRNWSHRSITPAVGIVETGPQEWSMYVSEHYGWSDNRLRRLLIRPWGLASLSAGAGGGQVLTELLMCEGGALRLNYSTSAAGSIRVEIQDSAGTPIPGYRLQDCDVLFGDELEGTIRWKGNQVIGIREQPIRLRFQFEDADLFSLQFVSQ